MTYPPVSVVAKLDRAREHLNTLEAETRQFVEGDAQTPWGIDIEVNSTAGEWKASWHAGHPPLPPRFAVIFGEFFYLVRSAMDHLAHQLVVVSKNTPIKENVFPVAESVDKFKSLGPQRMQGMSGPIQTAIQALQPYEVRPQHPTDTHIWYIHDFCNIDKHRLLHLSELWLFSGNVAFSAQSGGEAIPIRAHKRPQRMRLDQDALIAHYSWNPGRTLGKKAQMQVKFEFSYDVALAEGTFVDSAGNPFEGMGTLQLMRESIDYMDATLLPKFEPFFD